MLDKLVGFVAGASQAQLIEHGVSVEHYEVGSSEPFGFAGEDWDDDDGDDEEG